MIQLVILPSVSFSLPLSLSASPFSLPPSHCARLSYVDVSNNSACVLLCVRRSLLGLLT